MKRKIPDKRRILSAALAAVLTLSIIPAEFIKVSAAGNAKDAVYHCQVCGLVNGMPEGTFEPYSATTGEQGCAVMERMIREILNSKQN